MTRFLIVVQPNNKSTIKLVLLFCKTYLTIIAYGQTSSGKTFTIQGSNNDSKNKGIIPRIVI